jgi:hypothetical protein
MQAATTSKVAAATDNSALSEPIAKVIAPSFLENSSTVCPPNELASKGVILEIAPRYNQSRPSGNKNAKRMQSAAFPLFNAETAPRSAARRQRKNSL